MGGLCSKSSSQGYAYRSVNGHGNDRKAAGSGYQPNEQISLTLPKVKDSIEKQLPDPTQFQEPLPFSNSDSPPAADVGISPDDFYDGIPRMPRGLSQKSRSVRSTQAAVAKVSEVSSRLGRAGTLGLGKAVEVLDTLGSSMTNLNPSSGFVSGVVTKGNELSILAFEVANTIVKGFTLMHSLSQKSIKHLKEVVLFSEGVQNLVSKDMDELLRIVAADKREELKIFLGEVVRFGNRSKDPQWHNLERYFDKISRELTPQKQLKEEAEFVVEQLMSLVQYTAELYQELPVLDRFEQDYQHKRQEEDNVVATNKDNGLTILKAELKGQRKQVKILKKKSLWSRSLEEVMEKLVDVGHYLLLEMHSIFGDSNDQTSVEESVSKRKKLGPAGLDLHYANIIMQIDSLVARSSSIPLNTRDALYQGLPPNTKLALRSKMQSFHVKEKLTVAEIKAEMEKTLEWLVPVAANTAKAHHGFGWVGEWANIGSEMNRKSGSAPADIICIETLHHADKEKTEAYILEQVLWLQHLVSQSKIAASGGGVRSSIKLTVSQNLEKMNQQPEQQRHSAPSLTTEDQKMLQEVSKKKRIPGISKSLDFDIERARLRKHDRLSKSSGYSPGKSKESVNVKRLPSGIVMIGFGIDKKKSLDVIDRVVDLQ